MFSNVSARLGLPFMQASQAQKHLAYNEAMSKIDEQAVFTSEETPVAQGSLGAITKMVVYDHLRENMVGGPNISSNLVIPARTLILGVSIKVTETITGATSFNCGVSGTLNKFAEGVGVSVGSVSNNVIVPDFYSVNVGVLLQSVGSNFTGGSLIISVHGITLTPP